MVYLIHAEIGGTMNANDFGVSSGGWAGLRTTSLVNDFPIQPAIQIKELCFILMVKT